MCLNFPEDYDESQQRCKQIAHQLAQRHKHDNILLVCMTKFRLFRGFCMTGSIDLQRLRAMCQLQVAHGLSVEYLVSEVAVT